MGGIAAGLFQILSETKSGKYGESEHGLLLAGVGSETGVSEREESYHNFTCKLQQAVPIATALMFSPLMPHIYYNVRTTTINPLHPHYNPHPNYKISLIIIIILRLEYEHNYYYINYLNKGTRGGTIPSAKGQVKK